MAWFFLLLAALFEVGWPVGFKLASGGFKPGLFIVIICMLFSGYFFWIAQKQIPMGTAYAVWTGIGAAGTVAIGSVFFGDIYNTGKIFGISFIILGVMLLKVA